MTARTIAVVALLAAACSHSGSGSANAPAARPAPAAGSTTARAPAGHGMPMCPMAVEGTQVAAADTATGETVTFTTTPEHAADLRQRVHAMADMHNRHHADGEQAGGPWGGHHGMDHGGGMPPPSKAAVEDVENGARITVTPNDPADLQKLQSMVRAHAERMQREGCGPMAAPPRGS